MTYWVKVTWSAPRAPPSPPSALAETWSGKEER